MKISGTVSVSGQITGRVNISAGSVQETKTAIPCDEQQIITPDDGYNALAQVVVEPVPSSYGHIAYNGASLRVY